MAVFCRNLNITEIFLAFWNALIIKNESFFAWNVRFNLKQVIFSLKMSVLIENKLFFSLKMTYFRYFRILMIKTSFEFIFVSVLWNFRETETIKFLPD